MEGTSADRHWQTTVHDKWKVTQLTDTGRPKYLIHGRYLSWIYFVRKVLNDEGLQTGTVVVPSQAPGVMRGGGERVVVVLGVLA